MSHDNSKAGRALNYFHDKVKKQGAKISALEVKNNRLEEQQAELVYSITKALELLKTSSARNADKRELAKVLQDGLPKI